MLTKLGLGFLLISAMLLGYHIILALIGLGTSDEFVMNFFSISGIFNLDDNWLQGMVPVAAIRGAMYQVAEWPLFVVTLGLSILLLLGHMAFSKIG